MSEERENQDSSGAVECLLKKTEADESKETVDLSESKALASPESKAEVKYVSADSQNGDAKIDIENVRAVFAGMGKEELMRFANDPFWVRTRWILFALFWLLWLAMLVGAIAIIVLAPRCSAPNVQWWERSPLYEVNVRSFKDGSRMADGVGDLEGLHSKLDYIKDLGLDGVILSSLFPTGSADSPESVVDFRNIHRDLGSLDEFKELVSEMKKRDLHVLLDLVPNHSSSEHEWFQWSIKKRSQFKDFYIWSPGKGAGADGKNEPPNNWKSLNGGSAWEWNAERNEFYLHQFAVDQPDLNYHNPMVVEEMKNVLKFWLDLGVNGFHMRKTAFLVEDDKLQDEPASSKPGTTHESYDFFSHIYSAHQHESLGLVGQWRSVVSNVSSENILLVRDEFPLQLLSQNEDSANSTVLAGDLLQTPDFLYSLKSNFSVVDFSQKIRSAIDRSPSHWPIWRLGQEDSPRLASRFSPGMVSAIMMTTLLLPGTPIVLYGDEIGLRSVEGNSKQGLAPMAWNSSTNAGFTSDSIKAWVTISNSEGVNVASQLVANGSHLQIFKELVAARKTLAAVILGKTNISVLNASRANGTAALVDSVLVFTRVKSGNPGVLVAVNPLKHEVTVNLTSIQGVAEELTVHLRSIPFSNVELQEKAKIPRDAVKLPPESGIVFTFVYKEESLN